MDCLIRETEKASKTLKTTDRRSVRYSKRKNVYQYYLQNADGKLEYIRKKNLDQVRNILQKEYYRDLLNNTKKMRSMVQQFLNLYDVESVKKIYENIPDAKKTMVTPIIQTDEDYIDERNKETVKCYNDREEATYGKP